ncbi:MAG: HIT family protein, partial [Bacteroidota bacterium]|nr:HIT family protein [Bacteroidota bacterium]
PIAKALEAIFPCNRVNIITVGLEVPHAHVHLVPTTNAADVHLNNPKIRLSKEEFSEIQQQIISQMEKHRK